jgi:uncharacterized protein (TIGR02757 family)
VSDLREALEALHARVDRVERIAADPLAFPRRYAAAEDAEIAALLAAQLAYGRVDLFRPAIAAVLARADEAGGPRAWVDGWNVLRERPFLQDFVYRWNRGEDLLILFGGLRRVIGDGRLADALPAVGADGIGGALGVFVDRVRAACVAEAGVTDFSALPRGLRSLLAHPADGSACKRWNLMLRWLIRPADGVDLGLWTHIAPAHLVIPLDTHVHRIAQRVGLTARKDGSWRTAVEITEALRAFDAEDPVRFDFALAHLGISRGCLGERVEAVCGPCALRPVCRIAAG